MYEIVDQFFSRRADGKPSVSVYIQSFSQHNQYNERLLTDQDSRCQTRYLIVIQSQVQPVASGTQNYRPLSSPDDLPRDRPF